MEKTNLRYVALVSHVSTWPRIHIFFNIVFGQGKQTYQQEQIMIKLSINLLRERYIV